MQRPGKTSVTAKSDPGDVVTPSKASVGSGDVFSCMDLYDQIRAVMPDSFADVDRNHVKQWGSLSSDYTYSWFESLANAMNDDMRQNIGRDRYRQVVCFMANALNTATPAVLNCIDVSFVENLFWQVPPEKAEGYWAELPMRLQKLYAAFHGRSPLS